MFEYPGLNFVCEDFKKGRVQGQEWYFRTIQVEKLNLHDSSTIQEPKAAEKTLSTETNIN